MNNQRGITTTETVICLVVISVTAALSYPAIAKMQKTAKLRAETYRLVNRMQMMKMEAVKNNCYVALLMAGDSYNVFIDNGSGGGKSGDWVRQENERQIDSHQLPDGFNLTNKRAWPRFRFKGNIGNTGDTITLTDNNGYSMKVIVNISGRIRVEKEQ